MRARRGFRRLRRDVRFVVAAVIGLGLAVMAAAPGLLTDLDPRECSLANSLGRPQAGHWFGYDFLGCDYYARVVYGARTSLVIGVAVVAIAAALAVVLGSVAGYFGGWVDSVVTRASDVWSAIPVLLGGIFFLSFIEQRGVTVVVVVLAGFVWPPMMRIVRSSVQTTTTQEYVVAARALGAGHVRIITRHVVPNSLRPLSAYAALYTGTAIAAEAVLSFMGVGLQLPAISWGLMLAQSANRVHEAFHLLIPGVFLALVVVASVLLTEALRDLDAS